MADSEDEVRTLQRLAVDPLPEGVCLVEACAG
jgi:hypothetical protein